MIFILGLLAFFSSTDASADRFSDSGIRGPAYSTLLTYFGSLETKYPGIVEVNSYGKSVQGRPLVVIRVGYPIAYQAQRRGVAPAVLITGTTHGDEYLNIEDRLPEWFAKEGIQDPNLVPFFKLGGMIYFIPIVNPDGYEARERTNANGKDLNRDFTVKAANVAGFKELETKQLRDLMVTQLPLFKQKLVLTMDYHCCIGAALYPWSFKPSAQLPASDQRRADQATQVIKAAFGAGFPVGKTPDILGYSALGTSKDYYYETFQALSFTYEGEARIENQKFQQHLQMWKGLIRLITL